MPATDAVPLPFSVLLTVYGRDDSVLFDQALRSVLEQTRQPDEVVLVQDGPVGEQIEAIVSHWQRRHAGVIRVVALDENVGVARAKNAGIEACRHEVVAIMDADDRCASERFEQQIGYLEQRPEIDAVGAWIDEDAFLRRTALNHQDIVKDSRRRNPINHVTLVFRRSAIERAGLYIDRPGFTDYHLVLRLIATGARLANLPEVLVHVNTGEGYWRRRGGLGYLAREFRVQVEFWQAGFIGIGDLATNLVARTSLRVLPNGLRSSLYRFALRSKIASDDDSGASTPKAARAA